MRRRRPKTRAPEAPQILFNRHRKWGAPGAPVFFFFPKWAPEAPKEAPKGGANDATPPEGEGNPAEGGYFTSIYKYRNIKPGVY